MMLRLWLPVALAAGIGTYFSLPQEPSLTALSAALGICAACILVAAGLRTYLHQRLLPRTAIWALALACLGFGLTGIRAESLQSVRLAEAVGPIMLHGKVKAIESRAQGYRLIVEDVDLWRYPKEKTPDIVRLVVRTKLEGDIAPGDKIAVRVKLSPLSRPVYPGGYDFARAAYFQRIGAVGFSLSPVRLLKADEAARPIARHRHNITMRIANAMGNTTEANIATALITGEGAAIPEAQLESLRASGLAHILSISGLHMALVSGIIYVGLRGLFALTPLVLRFNTRKVAALLAVSLAGYYLLLAGMPVPATRAYIMIALFFLAVIADRVTTPLWPVAVAAMALLLIWPESLLSASFQMSFAAVTGLCAFFTRERQEAITQGPLAWRYVRDISLSSLVAGTATAPYAIHHFGRFALYGLLGNMLAMPVASFIIMPMGVLALLLMPLHLESLPLAAMGFGIRLMMAISDGVAHLPFSTQPLPNLGVVPLVLITLGGLWICTAPMRRWAGLLPVAVGVVIYVLTPLPDVLIEERGGLYAIRNGGQLLVPDRVQARYARENWMRALGVGKATRFSELTPDHRLAGCSKTECSWQQGGVRFYYGQGCVEADVRIRRAGADGGACDLPGITIDAAKLAASGTHAIWASEGRIRVETVAEKQGRRLWTAP